MKKNLLCCAMLGALGLAQAAAAQEYFDDRWYMTATAGRFVADGDRQTDNAWHGGIGFGWWLNPNFSIDIDTTYTKPYRDGNSLNWSLYGLGLTGRYHFRPEDRNWWPYFYFGAGALRHEVEYSDPFGGRPIENEGTSLYVSAGGGLQADLGRFGARAEIGARHDFDDDNLDSNGYTDFLSSVSLLVKFGPEPTRRIEPQEPAREPVITCADLDDDGDGVNNCDDRCPNSQPGQAVGPDGCPVPLTIDLRGVNFDFDKSNLRPDAIATLNEAIEVLNRYPDLRVEVAGHTDSIGTDAYNQGLSERRARAVYDYLVNNGINSSRLIGPVGYGESRPIAPNTNPDGSDNPEGRAQNRRTELNVEN
ncbi:MAG TPA: OmpA family protein [Xanthomonadaceae bacterium]|nr:OmpA family protein [Xanthomonadaceae bacterium]